MKQSILLFALWIICLVTQAQPPLQWVNTLGLTGNDIGYFCVVDGAGNSYLCGNFISTVDFDPGPGTATRTSVGSADAFLAKYDPAGNYLWAISWGSLGFDNAYRCGLDASGNVVVTGNFNGTIDFDPGPGTVSFTSGGSGDPYFAKFASTGALVWARVLTTGAGGLLYQPVCDATGNVHLSGYFTTSLDADPGPGTTTLTGVGLSDAFLGKYDASGNLLWAGSVAGAGGSNFGNTVAVDAAGNVHFAGAFSGTADFNLGAGTTNLTASGGTDIFFAKYTPAGALTFAKRMGAGGDDGANHIMVDASGNIYLMGRYNNTVDFDPNPGTANLTNLGGADGFVAKYDNAGNYLFAFRLGGTGTGDVATCGAFSADGAHIYVKGNYLNTVDFDPGAGTTNRTASGTNTDLYFAKYTTAGAFVWVGVMGNTSVDNAYSIAADATGAIWVSGSFQLTVDFDVLAGTTNRTSAGAFDAYLAKYQDGVILPHHDLNLRVTPTHLRNALQVTADCGSLPFTHALLERCTDASFRQPVPVSDVAALPFAFHDQDVQPGITYHYRLVLRQPDGTVLHSAVATGRLESAAPFALLPYPNPSPDGRLHLGLSLEGDEEVHLRILDLQGREVFREQTTAGELLQGMATGLSQGTYLVQVKVGGHTACERWVVW